MLASAACQIDWIGRDDAKSNVIARYGVRDKDYEIVQPYNSFAAESRRLHGSFIRFLQKERASGKPVHNLLTGSVPLGMCFNTDW